MPLSADLMELVDILNSEGFEVLAGELMTEIGLGREFLGEDLDEKISGTYSGDEQPSRTLIEAGEQLGYAARLLRLRLVEPIRRLAEAEIIAGRIQAAQHQNGTRQTPAVQIEFVPLREGDPPRMGRQVDPGDRSDADKLESVLHHIAAEVP